MKHKFVIMVASLLLAFVLVTTVIWEWPLPVKSPSEEWNMPDR